MLIRVAGLVPESFVDGSGLRFAVFMQGCRRRCAGCHNPQTHDLNGGQLVDTQEIIASLRQSSILSGVTLTGGEPFLQQDAAIEIARAAHDLGLDVWCYTGYTFDDVRRSELIHFVDVLVDGEFRIAERDLELPFRGSRNQRLIDVPASLDVARIILWRGFYG